MNATPNTGRVALLPALQELIDEHGPWPTLLALLKALRHRPAKPPPAAMLSDHLRRDIGLPDLPPARLRCRAKWQRYPPVRPTSSGRTSSNGAVTTA
jgi:hypothetical protein